jgi:translocation and assembly module TamA
VTVGDVDIELRGFVPFDKGSAPSTPPPCATAGPCRWARFRTADWEAAKRGMVRQIAQSRFPRAQLLDSSATVDPDTHRALLKVVIDSGPDARFGGLEIDGLKRYPASVITNLNQIRPGDEYNEAALQALQGRLQDTGYFASVEVSVDMSSALIASGSGPEGKRRRDATAAERTRDPARAGARHGEQAQERVARRRFLDQYRRPRPGQLRRPERVRQAHEEQRAVRAEAPGGARPSSTWPTTSGGYNNSVGAGYDRGRCAARSPAPRASTPPAPGARRCWNAAALEALTEQVTIDDLPTTRVKSLPLTFSITRRKLDSLVLPNRGYIVNLQLGRRLAARADRRKIRARLHARPRLQAHRRSGTLIVRGEFGAVGSKDKDGVPSTFLFRAGGDQSVRGYGYQQLGVPVGSAPSRAAATCSPPAPNTITGSSRPGARPCSRRRQCRRQFP